MDVRGRPRRHRIALVKHRQRSHVEVHPTIGCHGVRGGRTWRAPRPPPPPPSTCPAAIGWDETRRPGPARRATYGSQGRCLTADGTPVEQDGKPLADVD